MEKCMSNVMNDNCPEIIGCLFKKCNNSNYKLRSNGKFLSQNQIQTLWREVLVIWELRPGISI
jgi:hypothetical protein